MTTPSNTPSRRARAVALALAESRQAKALFLFKALLAAVGASAALFSLPGLDLF